MNLMPASATDAFPVLRPYSRFVATHLWIPLAAVLALSALLLSGGVDPWLATQIYHAEGGHWLLKDHRFTAKLVHRGGKQPSTAAALALLVFGLYARRSPRWNAWSRPALCVALPAGLSDMAACSLEAGSIMEFPRSAASFGSSHAFYGLS